MASCVDNIYDAPQSEIVRKTYAQKFQEMIGGPISRDQDFSVAKSYDVNVSLAAEGDVKIYSRANDKAAYQLVGHYENLSAGSHDLKFDAQEDAVEFAVEAGYMVKKTTGEAVSFDNTPNSRTYLAPALEDVYSRKDKEGNNIEATFTIDEIRSFDAILPAGMYSDGSTSIDRILGRIPGLPVKTDVAIDFKVVNTAAKTIKVYPIYWIAGYRHEFGIYTYNQYGEIAQEYVIYRSRCDVDKTDLMVSYDNQKTWESVENSDNDIYAYRLTSTQGKDVKVEPKDTRIPTHIKSQGFEVTLPAEGQTYGFFIYSYTNGKFGEAKDETGKSTQPRYKWYSDAKFNTLDNSFHAAFFQADISDGNGGTRKRTFLGFEDNMDGVGDGDLNDFMFILDPEPVIVNHTEYSWILAAEDLGDTDDFDFNDIVVSVSKVAGQKDLKVKALAAGGTLPVWLTFNDQYVDPNSSTGLSDSDENCEFHSWFSGTNTMGEDGLYPMLNTGRSSIRTGATAVIKDIPENYSITQFTEPKQDTGFAGFKMKVKRYNADMTPGDEYEYVTMPQHSEEDGIVGLAPQMMCLPYGWQWPLERVKMVEAYPQFGEWGTGYLNNTQWVNEYDETKIFK